MGTPFISASDFKVEDDHLDKFELDNGSRVGVIGCGPAGSFFSYFLLDFANRIGKDIRVEIYEPRDFTKPAPAGCNMCGGIVSESLVQALAADGINLPRTVVQRGIDSYALHMDVGSVRIDTPLQEKRIAAVTRGPGPRDVKEIKWGSFDGHLQGLAVDKGAMVIRDRVMGVEMRDGKPVIKTKQGDAVSYDLLVIASGVNSPVTKWFENLDIGYKPPVETKTFICEYYLGGQQLNEVLGNSMHVYLLDIPRLKFAAIIPKGDYATICMIGEDIDNTLIEAFLGSPEVKATMPSDWQYEVRSCNCYPRMNIKSAINPFADRIIFIGDCGVTRLYKDGIGAAYRTAKAAASTAVFQGVSAEDFHDHFMPVCESIKKDNTIGKLNFQVTNLIKKMRFTRRGLLRMTSLEQRRDGHQRQMSMVLWDMFTGSAPYSEILMRTMHPMFLGRFMWNILFGLFGKGSQ